MAKIIPKYSYSGESDAYADERYWYIRLLTSGEIAFDYAKKAVDACIVGGGAGGIEPSGAANNGAGNGGGGGAVVNAYGLAFAAQDAKAVSIGEGGAVNAAGNPTTAFGKTASGGTAGAGGTGRYSGAGDAGADGEYAFGDDTQKRYGADGGGGSGTGTAGGAGGKDGGGTGGSGAWMVGSAAIAATAGEANTGAGGGGNGGYDGWTGSAPEYAGGKAAAGGSGVVILRGTEADLLPVYFDGVQLSAIYMNGEAVETFTYAGKKIY